MTTDALHDGSVAVLSLGAGVQSTTLLLMACEGLIDPQPVEAVFADTGWEPTAVYDHLAWLESISTIPITRVSTGNIRSDALTSTGRFASMPLHIRNADGTRAMARRHCTREYKIDPIRRRVREIHLAHDRAPIVQMMGISLDELSRMRDSDVKYITHRYPLIDLRMTRTDCLLWMESRGYPRPPKSSCIGCPFHDDRYWSDMRRNDPPAFADAVDFDERIRREDAPIKRGLRGSVYLHRSCVPLAEIDLTTPEERGQLSMFDAECEGYCGI